MIEIISIIGLGFTAIGLGFFWHDWRTRNRQPRRPNRLIELAPETAEGLYIPAPVGTDDPFGSHSYIGWKMVGGVIALKPSDNPETKIEEEGERVRREIVRAMKQARKL